MEVSSACWGDPAGAFCFWEWVPVGREKRVGHKWGKVGRISVKVGHKTVEVGHISTKVGHKKSLAQIRASWPRVKWYFSFISDKNKRRRIVGKVSWE